MSKQRFDPETQDRIDGLYRFIIRTANKGEWEHDSDSDYRMSTWRHPSGLTLIGRNDDGHQEYQPYGDKALTDAKPFSRHQRKYIKRTLLLAWRNKCQQEQDHDLIQALTTVHDIIEGRTPPPDPDPAKVEQAASEVQQWIT
jgi:hypothetical protein